MEPKQIGNLLRSKLYTNENQVSKGFVRSDNDFYVAIIEGRETFKLFAQPSPFIFAMQVLLR